MTTARWKRRPEGSTWGDFGSDDQVGRLNLLTPAKVRQGIAEVRDGCTFCLSLPLTYPGGSKLVSRRHPPCLMAVNRGGMPGYNYAVEREMPGATDVISDDSVHLFTHYSTHWDSLAHAGALFDADGDGVPEKVYYNGFRAHEHVVGPPEQATGAPVFAPVAATALGIEHMATTGVQGRAVLIDLFAHLGDAHRPVGHAELMRIMAADGVVVEPGDMVCLHTGFARLLLDWGGRPDETRLHRACTGLDGHDAALRRWIAESGLTVLAADNLAVEHIDADPGPLPPGPRLPLHEHCLFKLGIHLGELWHLSELAAWLRTQGRSRFLLTAPPLRLPGAVGSPATPVATV
jgi:kynurenine formamidase